MLLCIIFWTLYASFERKGSSHKCKIPYANIMSIGHRNKAIPKFRLSTALVVSFVGQIVVAVGLTGWLSFRHAQQSVDDLVDRTIDEVATGVEHHVKNFADTPYQFLQLNVAAIRADYFDLTDYGAMERYFWEQIQISDAVPYIYFGNPQGDFVGVWRESEKLTTLRVRTPLTSPRREIYQLDRQGKREVLVTDSDRYDPGERPWYRAAVEAGQPTWSSIYVFATPPRLGITHAVPIYDDSEALLGVLAVDLTLSDISRFLRQLDVGKSGQVFIVERSGDIVASSISAEEEPPFVTEGDREVRLPTIQSSDSLIRTATENLLNRFGSFEQIDKSERFQFELEGQQQFLQVMPIRDRRGLDWLMVAVIPKADFTAQIDANTRNTIILCAIALAVATLSGVTTSRWITAPVLRVVRASAKVAKGEPVEQIAPSPIADIDILARSFNKMAGQLKESFNTLNQSLTTNQAIIETIPDLIIRAKGDGTYLDIFGNDRLPGNDEVQKTSSGDTVRESLPTDLAETRMHYIQQALKTGQMQVYEHQIRFDGPPQDEEVRILVLGENEVLIVVRNITARKQAERALERANQVLEKKVAQRTASLAKSRRTLEQSNLELRETLQTLEVTQVELHEAKEKAESANRAKSEFLANMSHELRTPLNSIIGFAQILSKDPSFQPDQQQRLNIINRSGEHLLSLIGNILEMSKIEAGQVLLQPKYFDLHEMLQDMQGMFCLKLRDKGLKFTVESVANLPKYIYADEGKLRQILINLVGNAVKFTETGSVCLRAGIARRHGKSHPADRDFLQLEVEDSGPGIPIEEMDRLFIPFEQTTAGRQLKQGTGLGLSITKKFIDLLDGEITVNSSVGEGTCFHVSVPVTLAAGEGSLEKQPRGKVVSLSPNQPSYRILVVDDEPDNCLVLLDFLTPVGFSVRQACNGKEATQIWKEWRPHLIWMDLRMPEMDGYEATRWIREMEAKERSNAAATELSSPNTFTKIVALTASVFTNKRKLAIAAGFDDYAIKPVQEEMIWEVTEKHLGVEFCYHLASESAKNSLPAAIAPESTPSDDLSIDIKSADPQWLAELREAASQLWGQKVLQLIEELPPEQSVLSNKLRTLAENYQFDAIVCFLDVD